MLDARVDAGLHDVALEAAPAAAEGRERVGDQALLVLDGLRQHHRMGLPLGDVQQPGVGFAHRRVVRDAGEHHAIGHLVPVDVELVPQVARAVARLVPLDAQPRVHVDHAADHPRVVGRGVDHGQLLDAQLLQPRDHAFVERRVGADAPHVLDALGVHAGGVGLQHDPV